MEDQRTVRKHFLGYGRNSPASDASDACAAGGGGVHFPDGSGRALYLGQLEFRPVERLVVTGGFSRYPIAPTSKAVQVDLLAEGWHSTLDWYPRSWRVNARGSRQDYSDGNRSWRANAEVLRWIESPRLAVGVGYRLYYLTFRQSPAHGYFDPSKKRPEPIRSWKLGIRRGLLLFPTGAEHWSIPFASRSPGSFLLLLGSGAAGPDGAKVSRQTLTVAFRHLLPFASGNHVVPAHGFHPAAPTEMPSLMWCEAQEVSTQARFGWKGADKSRLAERVRRHLRKD